ncbi:hypothetical protein BH10PSE1_BH10PSE1_02020 [soil metagenome]
MTASVHAGEPPLFPIGVQLNVVAASDRLWRRRFPAASFCAGSKPAFPFSFPADETFR